MVSVLSGDMHPYISGRRAPSVSQPHSGIFIIVATGGCVNDQLDRIYETVGKCPISVERPCKSTVFSEVPWDSIECR